MVGTLYAADVVRFGYSFEGPETEQRPSQR